MAQWHRGDTGQGQGQQEPGLKAGRGGDRGDRDAVPARSQQDVPPPPSPSRRRWRCASGPRCHCHLRPPAPVPSGRSLVPAVSPVSLGCPPLSPRVSGVSPCVPQPRWWPLPARVPSCPRCRLPGGARKRLRSCPGIFPFPGIGPAPGKPRENGKNTPKPPKSTPKTPLKITGMGSSIPKTPQRKTPKRTIFPLKFPLGKSPKLPQSSPRSPPGIPKFPLGGAPQISISFWGGRGWSKAPKIPAEFGIR